MGEVAAQDRLKLVDGARGPGAAIARGSYAFSYAVQAHDGQVALNLNGGDVTLRQGSGGAARLTGTVQYGLIRPGISETAQLREQVHPLVTQHGGHPVDETIRRVSQLG